MGRKSKVDDIVSYLLEDPWSPIPRIETLMRKFDCSRATAYKALQMVEHIDIVEGDDVLTQEEANEVYLSTLEHDIVNHPEHYTYGGIETIDYMKAKATEEEFRGHLRLTAIKYLSRVGRKGDALEDYKKAQWYLNKLIAEIEGA